MPPNKFNVYIHVKNFPTAVQQYKKILGFEPAKAKADYANFKFAPPPVIFSLTLGGEPGTVSHLGIRYPGTGEVASEKVRVKHQGIEMLEQKGATCCYAKADKFWVRDTEGMPWEFYTLLEDVEADTAADPRLREFLEQGKGAEIDPAGCCAPLFTIQEKTRGE